MHVMNSTTPDSNYRGKA